MPPHKALIRRSGVDDFAAALSHIGDSGRRNVLGIIRKALTQNKDKIVKAGFRTVEDFANDPVRALATVAVFCPSATVALGEFENVLNNLNELLNAPEQTLKYVFAHNSKSTLISSLRPDYFRERILRSPKEYRQAITL